VPTKGSGEALTEVMSGRADFYFAPVGFALQHTKSGKIVPLAVSSSQRSAAMPEVPTTVQAGFPDSDYDVWIAMLAPAGTPAPIIERLHAETAKALRSPEVQARFKTLVMDEMPLSVEQFNRFLAQDFRMNAELVKKAGIPLN
jgi:tripartite-type tricarboxylate transporter receptor subunit TctC